MDLCAYVTNPESVLIASKYQWCCSVWTAVNPDYITSLDTPVVMKNPSRLISVCSLWHYHWLWHHSIDRRTPSDEIACERCFRDVVTVRERERETVIWHQCSLSLSLSVYSLTLKGVTEGVKQNKWVCCSCVFFFTCSHFKSVIVLQENLKCQTITE